jgi:hypothetical protein
MPLLPRNAHAKCRHHSLPFTEPSKHLFAAHFIYLLFLNLAVGPCDRKFSMI